MKKGFNSLTVLEKSLGTLLVIYALLLKDDWALFPLPDTPWQVTTYNAMWWVMLGAGMCLRIGIARRPAALVGWLVHWLIATAAKPLSYGVDSFMTIGLFYLVIALFTGSSIWKPTLQIHLSIIYLNGGLAKAIHAEWWNGSAIWKALSQWPFNQISLEHLAIFKSLFPAIGIWVLMLEIGYAVLIWTRRTRCWCLAATIGMHIGIGLFLGLWLFALTMIVLNVAAFGTQGRRPKNRRIFYLQKFYLFFNFSLY